ncbi:MAG: AMP-binding protein [Oscillospiraceae bacterium]|nr:AMP-binding protein [Oscillospiraceae bacterium]
MYLYHHFCRETLDEQGVLTGFELCYPENYNFGYDVVDEMARLAPSQRAMAWCGADHSRREFTFQDISRLSNQAANVFAAHGVRKGDRVLVILKRHYEYWYVAPALHKLGAVMIPATHMLTREDLVYRVQTAGISAAICTPDGQMAEDLLAVQAQCPELETVFTVRRTLAGAVDFTAELEQASDTLDRVDTRAAEPMLMYFTSGTTGQPKAVIHDHTYSLSHIITARHWQCVRENGLHLTVAETGWGKASWGKLYGQWLCGCAVMVYDFNAFSPGRLLRVMAEFGVTSFCAPPTVYRYFVKYGMQRVPLPQLEHITTAGEALNPEVFRQVEEQTGLTLREGFGQTESVLMLGTLRGVTPRPGSMGKPTPLYQVALVDDRGQPVPDGVVGELVVIPRPGQHQHGIFMAYCGDELLYRQVWRGNVYHTGDTAWRDEDGYYWYVGRTDDLIKTRGFRVGPFEIENVLMEHPAVLECAVTGVPDPDRGQIIKGTVVPAEGYPPTKHLEQELIAFANSRMAAYKWISILELVEEMPKTISGKIRRVELREQEAASG